MNIFKTLGAWFGLAPGTHNLEKQLVITVQNKMTMVFYDYVISICCNKIANALSLCKFETYEKSKPIKNELWYKLNVSPNGNQNATDFWNKLVFEMVRNTDGALIVPISDGHYVADDYVLIPQATKPNQYKGVRLGDLILNKEFKERSVLKIKYCNTNLNELFLNIYSEVGKMLSKSIKNYNRANAKKYLVEISSQFDQLKQIRDENGNTQFDLTLDDLFKNRLSQLMGENDSATPIEEGLTVTEVKGAQTPPTTSDIRGLIDDIINFGADAFGIPRGLLKGDIADIEAMTDNFISFCINPLANQIEDEINRKLYTMEEVLEGTKVRIKTSSIKTYDPIAFANAAEALFRIRSVNTNWVREMLNEEPILEDWAEEYMETKNYQGVNNSEGTD